MLGAGEKSAGRAPVMCEEIGEGGCPFIGPGSEGEAVPGEDSPGHGGGALMAAVSQFEGKRRGKEVNQTGK
jgi:hypothetical protein